MKKVILLLIVILSFSTLLAEIDYYGQVRLGFWYTMENEDYTGDEARIDYMNKLYSNSRVGFNYSNKNFTAKLEAGVSESNISLRHFYGIQDFGMFKVLLGRTFSGFSDFASQGYGSSADGYLAGTGMLYDGTNTMIKFIHPSGIYFSLMPGKKMDAAYAGSDCIDALIPKVNIGMNYKMQNIEIHPTLGFAMSKYNEDVCSYDETVTAFAAAVTGKIDINPVTFKGQFGIGQNIGNYGFKHSYTSTGGMAQWDYEKNEVINTATVSAYLEATLNGVLTAGGGLVGDANENMEDDEVDSVVSYFIRYKLKLGAFELYPEVGVVNYMEYPEGNKRGAVLYAGSKLQVNIP